MAFKALLATKTAEKISATLVEMDEKDLMPGDVTVVVDYSTVNYKDAMAFSGRADVIKQFPLIPGIDLAGTVEASSYPGIEIGDRVLANSWGLIQTHHGGYAQKATLSGDWLVKIPAPLSTKDAMAIGTAGYTAMLSVLALEHGGVTPKRGDILVTGANGGVGSIAIALLSDLGYRVVASTGRLEEANYLKELGAAEIIDRRSRRPGTRAHRNKGNRARKGRPYRAGYTLRPSMLSADRCRAQTSRAKARSCAASHSSARRRFALQRTRDSRRHPYRSLNIPSLYA